MASWGMAKAKAQLSEVVHEAETTGPQKILRSGREVAVVVSIEEWRKLRTSGTQKSASSQSFARAIMGSPLHGMEIPRFKLRPRALDL